MVKSVKKNSGKKGKKSGTKKIIKEAIHLHLFHLADLH